ncbi:trehalase family glycosidase [Escherichia coli]
MICAISLTSISPLPKEGEKYVPPEGQSLREHIDGLWPVLTRSTEKHRKKWDSLLPLPEPYVVPGGRFREVYYWDSYFTMLGLAESGHWDKVADMVANFAHEIDTYGHIPNGNRSYYLSRSQPPFFALMVELLAQHEGDAALKQYPPQMQKEYAYWMDGVENPASRTTGKNALSNFRMVPFSTATGTIAIRHDQSHGWKILPPPKSNPNRPATEIYRDLRSAAASGWDFSSRWMDNPQQLNTLRTTSIVPVDLNSLMFKNGKKSSPAPAKLPEITRWQTSTKRWQMPVKKGSKKIPVERSTRLVCRLRPEKS